MKRLWGSLVALALMVGPAGAARAVDIPNTANCSATILDPHVFTVAPCGADPMPVVDVWILDYPDANPVEVLASDIWFMSFEGFQFCAEVHADSSTFAPDPGHTTISGVHGWWVDPVADCAAVNVEAVVLGMPFETLTFAVNGPDLSGDGEVTVTDFSLFGASWQSADPCADFDENGMVAVADLAIFAGWFNHCSCE
ncbi:MAG: hypothetical protein H6693_13230 [Candidatus Latescibacteria bacterium]|nr:hypothetical protein [Candidatus Latescibacterota bacterium]